MKSYSVYLCVLFIFLMSGCDNSSDQKQAIQNTLEKVKTAKAVKQEKKKQPVVYKRVKTLKKQPIQSKPSVDDDQDPIVPDNNQKILDLSIPFKFEQNTRVNTGVNNKQKRYLPDFFAEKKKSKESRVQVGGEMITKEEEEIEKQATVDGVGVEIKLTN